MTELCTLLLLVAQTALAVKYDFGYHECTYNTYYTKCFGEGYQLHRNREALTTFPPLLHKEECLVLEDNQISSFPTDLENYNTLYTLNVAKNRIQTLPDNLDILHKLKVLDLSANRLSQLSSSTRFPQTLEALILKGNSLQSLPAGLQMPNLYVLDLSNNRFSNIPREFCVSKQLIRVDFTQNSQIADVSEYVDVLNECRNVNEISFCLFTDRDYIKCDCETLGSIMLRKPAFLMGTPLLNQIVTCSATSDVRNLTGVHLFDVTTQEVGNACPAERQKSIELQGNTNTKSGGQERRASVVAVVMALTVSILVGCL